MLLFLVLLTFKKTLGVPWSLFSLLKMMLLLGLAVLTSFLCLVPFLGSLHWPQDTSDLGKFGISYFELLLMFKIFAGHRLQTEEAVRAHLRPRRPLVFSGFTVGMGQEIRHDCQCLHSLFRALGRLPGGLARFIPCQPSAHYTRFLHVGWRRCGHGLSSRPRESCDHQFLAPLLNFFGYPDGAVIRACKWHFAAPLFLHSFFPRNFHLDRHLISLVITRWLFRSRTKCSLSGS